MKTKVPLSEKALYQRINRKLQERNEKLKRSRGNVETTLGEYYIVNMQGNYVAEHHLQIEELGRDLGVMADWEFLQSAQ